MNFRSKVLTQSANGEACVGCGAMDGTVVWAHSNEQEHGKGAGIKAHDLLGNYLCFRCHQLYDGGTRAMKHNWFRAWYPITMVRVAEKLASGDLVLVAQQKRERASK